MILEEATDYIEKHFLKYAFILKNGTILKSTLIKDTIIKMFPIVSGIIDELPIKYMYHNKPAVIFRVSTNVLLIVLSKSHENLISSVLEKFHDRFFEQFSERYQKVPKSLKDFVEFSILTVTRQAGPEPFSWDIKDNKITEERIFKYSISSMMLLMDEINGANKRVLNFHPYVSEEMLGIVFLFQIPLN